MMAGQKAKKCQFCGREGLAWARTPDGRFFLTEASADGTPQPSKRHKCGAADANAGATAAELPPGESINDPDLGPSGQPDAWPITSPAEQASEPGKGKGKPQAAAELTPEQLAQALQDACTQIMQGGELPEVGQDEQQAEPAPELKTIGHASLPELVFWLRQGEHVLLSGPAGSFKTSAMHQAAEILGLTPHITSVCEQTSLSHMVGYMDAMGHYHASAFYTAYKNGGLYGLDEIDAGNANCTVVLNQALSNGSCLFPNGECVPMHKRFRCVAGANTLGNGADRVYVGRNELDGATLDRFQVMIWNYDEQLEALIAGADQIRWTRFVQACRRVATAHGITSQLFTPRSTFRGAKALRKGMAWDKAAETVLWARTTADERATIESNLTPTERSLGQ